jgi:hypothetical protein
VFGRLVAVAGAVPAVPDPEEPEPEEPEPEEPEDEPPDVCGLGDSGSMSSLCVVWDPEDPDEPEPESPNGSWYC